MDYISSKPRISATKNAHSTGRLQQFLNNADDAQRSGDEDAAKDAIELIFALFDESQN